MWLSYQQAEEGYNIYPAGHVLNIEAKYAVWQINPSTEFSAVSFLNIIRFLLPQTQVYQAPCDLSFTVIWHISIHPISPANLLKMHSASSSGSFIKIWNNIIPESTPIEFHLLLVASWMLNYSLLPFEPGNPTNIQPIETHSSSLHFPQSQKMLCNQMSKAFLKIFYNCCFSQESLLWMLRVSLKQEARLRQWRRNYWYHPLWKNGGGLLRAAEASLLNRIPYGPSQCDANCLDLLFFFFVCVHDCPN